MSTDIVKQVEAWQAIFHELWTAEMLPEGVERVDLFPQPGHPATPWLVIAHPTSALPLRSRRYGCFGFHVTDLDRARLMEEVDNAAEQAIAGCWFDNPYL